MYGSKEGHMGYIYKRKTPVVSTGKECDALFADSWNLVKRDSNLCDKQSPTSSHRGDGREHGHRTKYSILETAAATKVLKMEKSLARL